MSETMNKIKIFNNFAFYKGSLKGNSFHAHHCLQAVISLQDHLELLIEEEVVRGKAFLINQNIRHRIVSEEKEMLIILFEPFAGDEMKYQFAMNRFSPLEQAGTIKDAYADGDYPSVIEAVLQGAEQQPLDTRVQRILKHITREEHCFHGLDYFEKELDLSRSRITHLFKAETGVSFKYYVLWKKTLFAIDSFRSTESLQEVALDCGFSDLAHFSRTFRKLFGEKPSDIFARSASVQVHYSE